MTRYKLPEILGGGEIEAEEVWGGCAGGQPEYRLAGSEIVVLAPRGAPFEPVTPPLPPEPPIGSVVLFAGEAVQRFEDNDLADDPAEHWAGVGTSIMYSWRQLNDMNTSPPVLLLWAAADGAEAQP